MAAFFRATVAEFLATPLDAGMLRLTSGMAALNLDLKADQHAAWQEQWDCLQGVLREVMAATPSAKHWCVLLEYEIAGRRKRLDSVVLTDAGILAVEFKVGAFEFDSADRWQLREYCWNLRDFHRESRDVPIAPILVATQAPSLLVDDPLHFSDRGGVILGVICCGNSTLRQAIELTYGRLRERGPWHFRADTWDGSPSAPTPSVVDCARRLFEGHDVREIGHAHSDDTDAALARLHEAVQIARRDRKHIVCFVTGVPGAGKTLVGLNAAYRREMIEAADGPVCFASGNQPLLDVLQAALVLNRTSETTQRREIAYEASTPVKNVHDFAITTLTTGSGISPYKVVVFDEAQRVWDAEKLSEGLTKRQKRRKLTAEQVTQVLSYGGTEPEILLGVMAKCDWCVVIALVGGGQEIHDGEAGLAEWGRALSRRRNDWDIWASPVAIGGGAAVARQRLFEECSVPASVSRMTNLHLGVAKRSYRAEKYADWVNHVIAGHADAAGGVATELAEYPIWLTRDLATARRLLRKYAGDDLRSGLLASSGALRLRADGIEVSPQFRAGIKFPDWFLRPTGDIRSSAQLEVAATEFECQGLELDWCCVCWSGDFVVLPGTFEWQFRCIRAPARKPPKWYVEKSAEKREFLQNKYRVLLTRARVGVVLYVPTGDEKDQTREPAVFEATAAFLASCGATPVVAESTR